MPGRGNPSWLARASKYIYDDDNTGPGVSGGEFQDSVVHYHTPRSEGDFHSKTHDRMYALARDQRDRENADFDYFHKQRQTPELKYKVAAAAVGAQGLASSIKRALNFNQEGSSLRGSKSQKRFGPNETISDINFPSMEEAKPVDGPVAAPAAALAASGGSGSGKGSETGLQSLPSHIAFGIPKVFTCKHLYRGQIISSITAGSIPGFAVSNGADLKIRLNSVFDIMDNVASAQSPTWRLWAETYYDYYSVLGCNVKVTTHSNPPLTQTVLPANTLGLDRDWMISYKDYGSVSPASTAVNWLSLAQDPSLTQKRLKYNSAYNGQSSVTFEKFYTWKDYEKLREVAQDANDKIWTAKGASPALGWDLWVMARPMSVQNMVAANTYQLVHEVEVTVTAQWRELNATYKFWSA